MSLSQEEFVKWVLSKEGTILKASDFLSGTDISLKSYLEIERAIHEFDVEYFIKSIVKT